MLQETKSNSVEKLRAVVVSSAAMIVFIANLASTIDAKIVAGTNLASSMLNWHKKCHTRRSSLLEIEADLREKTGLQSIHFNRSGVLAYDPEDLEDLGSRRLRQTIVAAIDDPKHIFEICDFSGSRHIHFAVTDEGTIVERLKLVGSTYYPMGKVIVYRIQIDFSDYKNSQAYTPREVYNANTLGITLFHEIDHKVSYDPDDPIPPRGTRPDRSTARIRGVIENTNTVRRELSLPIRETIYAKAAECFGRSESDTYQISFRTKSGKRRFLRWKRND